MRRHFFARSFLRAFGELFDFAGPVKSYPIASADEITRDAWNATGRAMRGAMNQVDEQLGYTHRTSANH
ncbi:hypothetical protein [Acetobacter sp. UBA5411]|uniref:hypothetical protein n=1 Tax=Acetobacter sp. UBA5411 TaxID=1945905 RepID=UPI0025C20C30|nr:hypothetical protein [Acetobacter sp. UBA5411]